MESTVITDKKKKIKIKPFRIIMFTILALWSISFIYVLLWALMSSLKSIGEFRLNKTSLLPKDWAFDNYVKVFKQYKIQIYGSSEYALFPLLLLNTFIYVVLSSVTTIVMPYLVAYCNVKFSYRFNKFIYGFVLVSMIIPVVGAQAATLKLLNRLHIYDTWLGLFVLKSGFLGIEFLIFHSAFRNIPKELSEAACVDGASELRTLVQIILPQTLNICGVLFITSSIGNWNNFMYTRIWMPKHPTLALALHELSLSYNTGMSAVPMRLTACFILIIPILTVFIIFKDKMMISLNVGGVKE